MFLACCCCCANKRFELELVLETVAYNHFIFYTYTASRNISVKKNRFIRPIYNILNAYFIINAKNFFEVQS